MAKNWLIPSSDSPAAIPVSKLRESVVCLQDLLGHNWVQDQLRYYGSWRRDHSLPSLWNHRPPFTNPLLPMFNVVQDWDVLGKRSGRPPTAVIDLATIAGEIFYFESYWSSLPGDAGRKHIRSYLRNAETCRGMLYEAASAFHYVRAGASPVIPLFMNPNSSEKADILVTWEGATVEVHCKSKIPGSGQKIHADLFDYLAGCALAYFDKCARHSVWVKLICDDELRSADVEYLRERIHNLIQLGLVGDYPLSDNRYVLQIKEIEIPRHGIPHGEILKLHKSMYRAILADDKLSVSGGGRYFKVCLFDAVSRKRPRVASSLRRSIREAKEQATGQRPSIVSVHFYDPMHWEEANRSASFKAFLEEQLKTPAGRNVGALALTGEPFTAERWTGHIFERSLPAIWFRNSYANPQVQLPSGFQLSGRIGM